MRFLSPDAPEYLNHDTFSTNIPLNMYAYCENDPVQNLDPNGNYSRTLAVNYAKKWYKSYNPNYYTYDKKHDCANFVSQCLYEGKFMSMNSKWHSWKIGSKKIQVSDAWGNAEKLYKYLKYWLGLKTIKINSIGSLNSSITERRFQSGDVAFITDKKWKVKHAILVGSIVGYGFNKGVYYYGHSNSRNGADTSRNNEASFAKVINKGEYIIVVKIPAHSLFER